MFRSKKPTIANFHADYATHADFCDVFRNETQPLYLLAFLLTANHKESEKCFVATVEEAFKEPAVFREWARSWVKRKLIENAIEIVSPASDQIGRNRDLWSAGQRKTQRECGIDAVAKLDALERFVFVMSILERYSNRECALLLDSSTEEVAHARMKALRRLPRLAAPSPRADGPPMRRQHVAEGACSE